MSGIAVGHRSCGAAACASNDALAGRRTILASPSPCIRVRSEAETAFYQVTPATSTSHPLQRQRSSVPCACPTTEVACTRRAILCRNAMRSQSIRRALGTRTSTRCSPPWFLTLTRVGRCLRRPGSPAKDPATCFCRGERNPTSFTAAATATCAASPSRKSRPIAHLSASWHTQLLQRPRPRPP